MQPYSAQFEPTQPRSQLSPASPSPEAPETPSHLTITPEKIGMTTADFRPFLEHEFAGIELGRYLILGKIGRGGMGLVFRARDSLLGREVALKLIRSGLLAGEQEVNRFIREAQAVAQLNHPHIVKIFDFGQIQGQPFFTMALASEGSLLRHIKRIGEQPWAAATLMGKIARAVHYIHERGLLHRDLKPGNILVETGDEPLISDFGLARPIESSDLTRPGDVPGTLLYMAPEQAGRRPKEVGPCTDVWALGVIFYEMLCGQKPFRGENEEEILGAIQNSDPPRPRQLRKGLDISLETIVLKCLQKEPQHRYLSAIALADDIDHWLRGEPIKARPFPWWRKALRAMRRHPVVTGFGVLLMGALLALPIARELMDPERIVKNEILPQLAAGERVTLIGQEDGPKWYRWRLPGIIGPKRPQKPQFNLNTGARCVLELLPTVPVSSFRYGAEINLESGKETGLVVSYAAHSQDINSFMLFGYSKVDKAVFVRRIQLNMVPGAGYREFFKSDLFQKPNVNLSAWNRFLVEVAPPKVTFSLQGLKLYELNLDSPVHIWERKVATLPRDSESGLNYDFSLQNGIGLFLRESSVSFQNVFLESL